jgi:hypothetical protein
VAHTGKPVIRVPSFSSECVGFDLDEQRRCNVCADEQVKKEVAW